MKSGLKRRLQTGTALICSLAMAFSVLPVSAEESTQSLESKTSDLAGQLAGINQELVAIRYLRLRCRLRLRMARFKGQKIP